TTTQLAIIKPDGEVVTRNAIIPDNRVPICQIEVDSDDIFDLRGSYRFELLRGQLRSYVGTFSVESGIQMPPPPGAPILLSAVAQSDSEVLLTWDGPDNVVR